MLKCPTSSTWSRQDSSSQQAGLRANHFDTPLWKDEDLAPAVQSWDESILLQNLERQDLIHTIALH
jgi:hypothetical protein